MDIQDRAGRDQGPVLLLQSCDESKQLGGAMGMVTTGRGDRQSYLKEGGEVLGGYQIRTNATNSLQICTRKKRIQWVTPRHLPSPECGHRQMQCMP